MVFMLWNIGTGSVYPKNCIYIDGLVQERRNSSALALELSLSCINLLMFALLILLWFDIGQPDLFDIGPFYQFDIGAFYPYPSRLIHWRWDNLTIAPVPVKRPETFGQIIHLHP